MIAPIEDGVVVALLTPLDDAERVDEPALRALLRHVMQGGVHGILAMGTSGEATTLAEREWRRGLELVIEEVNGKMPVLAGILAPATELAIQRLREVERMGAAAAVACLPYYYATGKWEAVCHFQHLARASHIPIYAYNIGLTKMVFGEDVVSELVAEDAIVGLKDSVGDFTVFQKVVARYCTPKFCIFQGNETMLAHSLFAGASGGVLGLANVAPRLCVDLYEACVRREYERAYALQGKLVSLHSISRITSSALVAQKYALSLLGLMGERATRPLRPLSAEEKTRVQGTLAELGLLQA